MNPFDIDGDFNRDFNSEPYLNVKELYLYWKLNGGNIKQEVEKRCKLNNLVLPPIALLPMSVNVSDGG